MSDLLLSRQAGELPAALYEALGLLPTGTGKVAAPKDFLEAGLVDQLLQEAAAQQPWIDRLGCRRDGSSPSRVPFPSLLYTHTRGSVTRNTLYFIIYTHAGGSVARAAAVRRLLREQPRADRQHGAVSS